MKFVPKLIFSSKQNLQQKYGTKFSAVEKLLKQLVAADKKKFFTTKIIYIDDKTSAKKAGITPVTSITRKQCKTAVDQAFKKWNPVYMVIFGAQDIFPFQEIQNPVKNRTLDDDDVVPSDLPYACDAPYSTQVSAYTGPSRVVGRIPDVPGVADMGYLQNVFSAILNSAPAAAEDYENYFAVSAKVWSKSTHESVSNIFGNSTKVKDSPPAKAGYTAAQVKPLIHFFNCHGSPLEAYFYGQTGKSFPNALHSSDIDGRITEGTVVAAECCYGAQVYDPVNSEDGFLSIANTYLGSKALAFAGSSTIAYGPAEGQGLADLITQYFIKGVLAGASTGRAFLEARQKFLAQMGPALDPYELKTLAQFYLLGDPGVQPVLPDPDMKGGESIDNRRLNLFSKGINLKANMRPCRHLSSKKPMRSQKQKTEVNKLFKRWGFSGKEKETQYKVPAGDTQQRQFAKSLTGSNEVIYRTFVKEQKRSPKKVIDIEVLVVKVSGNEVLGHRVYVAR